MSEAAPIVRDSIVPYTTARKAGWTDVDFLGSAAVYDLVVGAARSRPVRVALSNSLGFGGSNSCLAFRHPDLAGGAR